MELLHKGFDSVDIAFKTHIPSSLADILASCKTEAAEQDRALIAPIPGIHLQVEPTGAKGGYAYRCSTGALGAIWFFKKPKPKDPWGVRVSCRALPLALYGLDVVRRRFEAELGILGMQVFPAMESIGRVDFAVDFLAPKFSLNRDQFVMHARCNRSTHFDIDTILENGHSGRAASVTIGKNPGRQICVYDKRHEVISRNKKYWFEIWNANLQKGGLPHMDFSDAATSRVWRVELRAYKKHLKDRWGITTWNDLSTKLQPLYARAMDDIRYTCLSDDSNRARWVTHPLWRSAQAEIVGSMTETLSPVDPDEIKDMVEEDVNAMLKAQISGCLITLAARQGVSMSRLTEWVTGTGHGIARDFSRQKERTEKKYNAAREKYEGWF